MSEIKVIPLDAAHIPVLTKIDEEQLGPGEHKTYLETELELTSQNPETHFHLVAVWGGADGSLGEPVGHLSLKLAAGEASIERVATAKSAEGAGVASRLLLAALKLARNLKAESLVLEARASNKRAQQIYSRFGLKPVGVRKDYYRIQQGEKYFEDAILYLNDEIQSEDFHARLKKIEAEMQTRNPNPK